MKDLTRIEYLELVNQMISTYEQRMETNDFSKNGRALYCPICIKMIELTANASYKCTRCPNDIDGKEINGCTSWASYRNGWDLFARRRLEVFKRLKILLEVATDDLSVEGMRGLQAVVHFDLGYNK